MKVTREREACLLGSAILAAVGAGLFADIPSAVDAMVHVEGTVVSHPRSFVAEDGNTPSYATIIVATLNLCGRTCTASVCREEEAAAVSCKPQEFIPSICVCILEVRAQELLCPRLIYIYYRVYIYIYIWLASVGNDAVNAAHYAS